MGHSATLSVSGEPFLCFLGTTRPFGKRVLWTLKFLDPKKKKTKTASKHGDKKKHTRMTRIPSRPTKPLFHLRWLAYSKSSYGHQELWIHHLSTAENWKPVVLETMIRIKGYQLLALTPCLMKWQKKLNCTNLSEHWEALQPTKLEYTVLMVLAQVVKKKSHCMASLRSRTTHGCAFSVFFLGLWSSSTVGAVRNSWSQTAAGSEVVGSFL